MQPSLKLEHFEYDSDMHRPRIYRSVFELLKRKIDSDELPRGARVKEGQIASILGISRAPVRQAIELLLEDGAVEEVSGQGFIVGANAEHRKIPVEELRKIIIGDQLSDFDRTRAWEKIFVQAKREMIACLPFGTYRVSESELARYFSVSRTVAREVLARLSDLNIIEKNRRSQWIAGPLTARDLSETMSMRVLLEPFALELSSTKVDDAIIEKMRQRVTKLRHSGSDLDPELIVDLESDLHHELLQYCGNSRLLVTLERNQLHSSVEELFNKQFGTESAVIFVEEHTLIFDQLLDGQLAVAQAALTAHLKKSANDLLRKLRVLSVLPKPQTAPYLIEER